MLTKAFEKFKIIKKYIVSSNKNIQHKVVFYLKAKIELGNNVGLLSYRGGLF